VTKDCISSVASFFDFEDASVLREFGTRGKEGKGALVKLQNAPQHRLSDSAELLRDETTVFEKLLIVLVRRRGFVRRSCEVEDVGEEFTRESGGHGGGGVGSWE
jgi:hypothetical protein